MTREPAPKPQVQAGRMADADYAALASFRRAIRIFLAFSEQAAREAGLTPQQHQALLTIRGLGQTEGTTVGELATHLLLKHHTTVELVDRLVRAKLIARKSDPDDRRRVRLTLTVKAERTLASLSAVHLAEIRRHAPQLVELIGHFLK
jgi:DNA-binding MarR family transcriptional regulator